MIYLKLTGLLKPLQTNSNNEGYAEIDYKENLKISDITENLDFSKMECTNFSVLVNSKRQTLDYILCDCDKVIIMPLIAGG